MTTPRHARALSLHDWMDEDHELHPVVLLPVCLAGLTGLFGLAYALLFG